MVPMCFALNSFISLSFLVSGIFVSKGDASEAALRWNLKARNKLKVTILHELE